jgi:hypothetical protein
MEKSMKQAEQAVRGMESGRVRGLSGVQVAAML